MMNLKDIENTTKLIDKINPIVDSAKGLSGVYIDDSIILDDLSLTKVCILFDNIMINHINPNLYIHTIYKDFNFNEIKDDKISKVFYGQVENYNFINFINSNKDLVKEGVLTPKVFHNIPMFSKKTDKEILLELVKYDKQIIKLVKDLQLKREKGSFCIDEPFLYILKLININFSFLRAVISKKIVISEKVNVLNYAVRCGRDIENIHVLDNNNFVRRNYSIKDIDINSSINNLIVDTFDVLVPNFPKLNDNEILEVRYKLRNELGAYRTLIKDISKQYETNKEINNSEIIQKEFTNKINDINLKLKSEKSKLFRKIVTYATAIPTASGILSGGDMKSIVASCFGSIVKIGCDVNEYYDTKRIVLNSSDKLPYTFLIKAKKIK